MDEYANPNGGASGGGLGTQAADSSGPLEQRIVSKNWQVRAAAYDEISLTFKGSNTPNDESFKEHAY